MEATLAAGRAVITRDAWKSEIQSVLAAALIPHDYSAPTRLVQYALSESLQSRIKDVINFAISRMTNEKAKSVLHAAIENTQHVKYLVTTDAEWTRCCFTGSLAADRLQISFCRARPDGGVDRTHFYAMRMQCLPFVMSVYLISHVAELACEMAREWYADRIIHTDEDGHMTTTTNSYEQTLDIYTDRLREAVNCAMCFVYQTVTSHESVLDACADSPRPVPIDPAL